MTNEEAIRLLKLIKTMLEWEASMDFQIALDMAIEAIEKRVPNKPEKNDWSEHANICPNCHNYLDTFQFRCLECGQMIDWSDYE